MFYTTFKNCIPLKFIEPPKFYHSSEDEEAWITCAKIMGSQHVLTESENLEEQQGRRLKCLNQHYCWPA